VNSDWAIQAGQILARVSAGQMGAGDALDALRAALRSDPPEGALEGRCICGESNAAKPRCPVHRPVLSKSRMRRQVAQDGCITLDGVTYRADPPEDDGIGRCRCEWAHPVDGAINPGWPAETDPVCVVHAGETPDTVMEALRDAIDADRQANCAPAPASASSGGERDMDDEEAFERAFYEGRAEGFSRGVHDALEGAVPAEVYTATGTERRAVAVRKDGEPWGAKKIDGVFLARTPDDTGAGDAD